jgi:sugar O-acyltransferase (sialic acid O-acetyltransferase NeuD family)
MKKISLILLGRGGHCRSCIDVVEQQGKFAIRGIVDAKEQKGNMVLGYPVLGNDELLDTLINEGHYFLVTVGHIKSAAIRTRLFKKLMSAGANMAIVISPKAHVSQNAKMEIGTIVMHGAVVNAGAAIGCNSIINTLSLVEHDTSIGNHVHISTGAIINGGCSIGDESFIGSGTVVSNNLVVGNKIVIGAGSVVVNNIGAEGVYLGCPAKKINE